LLWQLTTNGFIFGTEMFQWQDQATYKHVWVNKISVHRCNELVKLKYITFSYIVLVLCNIVPLFVFYIVSTLYRSYGDFPALLVQDVFRCPLCIISGLNRHLSGQRGTTDLFYASWIASSCKRIQISWQD
jgi:hypothetical protein